MPSLCLVKETVIRQSLPVRQSLIIFINIIRIIYSFSLTLFAIEI